MPTPLQVVQLVVAAGIPLSLWVVMTQIRDVKWIRLAPGVVVSGFLGIFILTAQGVVPALGAAFITMLLLGHMTSFLDDD